MGNCCGSEDAKSVTSRQPSTWYDSWAEGRSRSQASNSFPTTPARKFEPDYVVFWDYKSSNKSEIELKHGDELVQLDENEQSTKEAEGWVFVMRTAGDRVGVGYVPRSLLVRPVEFDTFAWNFGPITRDNAEAILRRTRNGTFLVRARMPTPEEAKFASAFSAPDLMKGYVLSVKYTRRECKHYKILRTVSHGHPYFSITGDSKPYKALKDMIDDLRAGVAADILCCALKRPAPRPRPAIGSPLPPAMQDAWQQVPRHRVKLRAILSKKGDNANPLNLGLLTRTPVAPRVVVIRQLQQAGKGGLERFLTEAVALKNLGRRSSRFVQLVGVVTIGRPLLLLMEYAVEGSLRRYLRKAMRTKKPLPEKALVDVCMQIADAMRVMEHLSIVHRSLSADHILVYETTKATKLGENTADIRLRVKITGLGLSTALNHTLDPVKASGGVPVLPVKWTAPELLDGHEAATSSDVWSYGITVHEIFTHGTEPYSGLTDDSMHKAYLQEERVVERDPTVPLKVYELICRCCKYNPEARLSFSQIHIFFDTYYLDK